MGLYGAMTQDDVRRRTPTRAFPTRTRPSLLYSEIDPALHEAVANGNYGTRQGRSHEHDRLPAVALPDQRRVVHDESTASLAAGTAGETTLLRFLNAGLRTHVPVLDNGSLQIVAEDGNKLPFAKDQAGVMLAAGKTHDVALDARGRGRLQPVRPHPRPERARAGLGGHAGQAERRRGGGRADAVRRWRRRRRTSTTEGTPLTYRQRRARQRHGRRRTARSPRTPTAALLDAARRAAASPTRRGRTSSASTPSPTGGQRRRRQRARAGHDHRGRRCRTRPSRSRSRRSRQGRQRERDAERHGRRRRPAAVLRCLDFPSHGELSYIDPLTKVRHLSLPANQLAGSYPKAIPGGIVIYTPDGRGKRHPAARSTLPLRRVRWQPARSRRTRRPTRRPASVTATVFADADSPGADFDSRST